MLASGAGAAGVVERLERDRQRVGPERRVAVRERGDAAEAAELEDHRLELAPALGQLVDPRAGRRASVRRAHQPGALQLAQALGEHVGADLRQPGAQVGEALGAEQQLAHDQQRPALADEVERARDAAAVSVVLAMDTA